MEIISCNIGAFGRLVNKKIEFRGGFNKIIGDNGSGKTTLAAFIKAMFYGLCDNRKTGIAENDRRHYYPWRSTSFGGSMTFSVDEKEYRVERHFGQKPSEDRFALFDMKTGKPSTDFSSDLGEEIFGIDAEGFEQTVFFSEKNLSPSADNKSVYAKLGGLDDCQGDIGDLDSAFNLLEKERKRYSKKSGGKIGELEAKITDNEKRLVYLKAKAGRLPEEQKILANYRLSLNECNNKFHTLSIQKEKAILKKAERIETQKLENLQTLVHNCEERLRMSEEFFNGLIPSIKEIEDVKSRSVKVSEPPIPTVKINSRVQAFTVFSLLVVFLGVILGALINPVLFSFSVIGVIFGLYTAVTALRAKKRVKGITQSTADNHSELKSELSDEAKDFLERYGLSDVQNPFDILLGKVLEHERLSREANDRRREYELIRTNIGESFDKIKTDSYNIPNTNEITQAIEVLEAERLDIQRKITLSERTVDELIAMEEEISEVQLAISELKIKLSEDEKSLEIIRLTKLFLEEAKDNLSATHLGTISDSFGKYSKLIAGDCAAEPRIDTSFKISFNESGISRPAEAYSKGTKELYNLVARFAVIDSLYRENTPPIILDDPFTGFDDGKLVKALEVLEQLAKKKQIIYFTCSKARAK